MWGCAAEFVIELSEIGQDRELVNHRAVKHVSGVEEGGDAQLPLGHPEGKFTVANRITLVQPVVVDQVRPESVYDGTEGEPTAPGLGHVVHLDPPVAPRDPPAPHIETLHPRH